MQTLGEIHTHHVRCISGRAMLEDDYDALVAAYRDDVVAFLARCVFCVLGVLEFSFHTSRMFFLNTQEKSALLMWLHYCLKLRQQ